MTTISTLYSNREQSTGQSVKTKHIAKIEKTSETTTSKRTKNATKVTFVSDVESHTVSATVPCTMYTECPNQNAQIQMYSEHSLVMHTVTCEH